MLENYIHKINEKDIIDFRHYCSRNTHFFSDSLAFINSYLRYGYPLCYNDGKTIFFINSLDENLYFFCCPKGLNWQKKIINAILDARVIFDKHLKKIWLWELPQPLQLDTMNSINSKSIALRTQKRYLLKLFTFENLSRFLSQNVNLRKKWRSFFKLLNKQGNEKSLVFKNLNSETYIDAIRVMNNWQNYKTRANNIENQIISKTHIYKKNLRMLSDALANPNLYESIILYYNGYPRGIKVAFKIEKSRNLSGSISCVDRTINNIGIVINLLFFKYLAKKGYEWFNWGSSYLPSIEKFKQQFHPIGCEYSYEYFIKLKD